MSAPLTFWTVFCAVLLAVWTRDWLRELHKMLIGFRKYHEEQADKMNRLMCEYSDCGRAEDAKMYAPMLDEHCLSARWFGLR